ncbi:MAG TPA: M14 family zinc carboxypeptidase [Longimicrobiaceae bacterium]|nr:M14 family zinc carboxypeptidase [Longimicrobiaceae bacterium]
MRRIVQALAVLALLLLPALAAAQQAPSPEAVLGHRPGESGWLASWEQIQDYFAKLDAASPMVRVERIGHTAQNRPMILAIVTSEANQARLAELQAAQAKLADPRGVPEAELERIVARQPAVAMIGASLHGNEIMATQMSMELAHDLVSDPSLRAALDSVVVLLVPGMNPDGLDITRDWWLRTRNTEYDGARMPWLYHYYTGHDNNRDFFMITQPETKAVSGVMYDEWFPEVFYDVHQMGSRGPRMFVPPFEDPLNPNLDPLIVRETNLVGTTMALALTEAGKTGVTHRYSFDLWWDGGARTVPARHNMVGILSEVASTDYGDPITVDSADLRQPETGSMYPEPWPGGVWRPRDIVEYELTAAKALVGLLRRQRSTFVGNYLKLAQKETAKGKAGDPFAYVVPVDQRDPGSAAEMLRVLQREGIEVERASAPFQAGGQRYAAGSWVVPMAQPYRAAAKDLLEPQRYPDRRLYPGGPPAPPYDLAGWTLPMQMGVEAVAVAKPFDTSALAVVDSVATPAGRVAGRGSAYALDPTLNATHRAIHAALRAGGRVTFSSAPVTVAGVSWPAGTPVVSHVKNLSSRVQQWANDWGVNAAAVRVPEGRTLSDLRVGLYKPWTGNMDEGWTRFLFEQWGVPFDTIHDAEMRAGDLGRRYDAIVVPQMSYREMTQGLDPKENPPEYAGGLAEAGVAALKEFVRQGGTLVLLGEASAFGIEALGVPVTDVETAQDRDDPNRWYAPGSLLRVEWNHESPITTGMPEESAVFYARGPVFQVNPGAEGVTVVARYPEKDILLSGYDQGEERIAGKAAAVSARVGAGRVVMFGFRPQHRVQTHDTFKVLFNAVYQ